MSGWETDEGATGAEGGSTMVVVFANNLTLVAVQGTTTTVHTDPVPLNGNDRASCIVNVHSIFATGGTPVLTYQAQVSNDAGQNFVDVSGVADTMGATGVQRVVGVTAGAILRFKYTLSITGGSAGNIAAACFDLHVNMDHA